MTEAGAKSPRKFQYYFSGRTPQSPFEIRAIRNGPWKYHASGELHHLLHDVSEKHNVAARHPEIAERLSKQIRAFDDELRRGARPVGSLQ